jgi:hypothetical protein
MAVTARTGPAGENGPWWAAAVVEVGGDGEAESEDFGCDRDHEQLSLPGAGREGDADQQPVDGDIDPDGGEQADRRIRTRRRSGRLKAPGDLLEGEHGAHAEGEADDERHVAARLNQVGK